MNRLMDWFKRRGNRPGDLFDAEMRFHIERQIADYVRDGSGATEARHRALLEFGGIDLAKEECRDLFVLTWLEESIRFRGLGSFLNRLFLGSWPEA